MRNKRAKIFRCLFLIVIAPVFFPIAGLLWVCERAADFFDNRHFLDAWCVLFLEKAYKLFPYENENKGNTE